MAEADYGSGPQSSIDMTYIEQMIADFEKPVARLAGPSKLAKLLSFSK